MSEAEKIDEFQLACQLARENFGAYIQLVDRSYEMQPHHVAIIKQLHRMEQGTEPRCLIQLPPRHGKSQTATILYPAWYLGRHPNRKVISASCTQDLANDFGTKVRNLINDPLHRAVFPECVMSSDSQAKDHFTLTAGGEYVAVGRGSTTVGRGANCLVAGTLVLTDHGELPIEELAARPAVRILSYDPATSRCEYQRLEAVHARHATRLRRITTASGRVVESTGDHPFFVSGQYVEAAALAGGDRLMRAVRDGGVEGGIRDHETREAGIHRVLLRQRVLGPSPERAALWEAGVYALRPTGTEGDVTWYGRDAVLLQGVPGGGAGGTEGSHAGGVALAHLRAVQSALSSSYGAVQCGAEEGRGSVLLPAVRRSGAFVSDVLRGQSEVEAWGIARPDAASLRQGVQEHAANDPRARRPGLRRLQDDGCAAGGPPHRRQPDEQCGGESGDALLEAPPILARGEVFQAIEDAVAVADDVYREAVVYDIQVAVNHNFFANGVLVSNCLLIDDPTKDSIEAASEHIQQQMYDWFTTVARTRLEPPNSICVIETLWSEACLSAWLARQPKAGYKLVRFPAIAEDDERDDEGRIVRKKGEALWPSRFPVSDLEEIRDGMRSDHWLALFQQRATAETGNYFKTIWLDRCYYDRPNLGEGLNKYVFVDPASSKKRTSDFTSMWVLGFGADRNVYVLDIVRDKLSPSELADVIFSLHAKWLPISVICEEYALSAIIAFVRERQERMNYRFDIQPIGGPVRKEERIKELEPWFRTGRLQIPRHFMYRPVAEQLSGGESMDLMKTFLEEYRSFPNAAHDDMLDSLARFTDPKFTPDWPLTSAQMSQYAAWSRQTTGRGTWMAG